MPASKNLIAATLTREEAQRQGVVDAPTAEVQIQKSSKKLYGFNRKLKPEGLPTEPKLYIFSLSEYGEKVSLGPGFPSYEVKACPEGQQYGEPTIIDPIHFFEEAKVDVTEHTFTSGQQIVDSIMRRGPGMNAAWDRAKVGWFVSRTPEPTPEEISRCREIYLNECKRLYAEGNKFFASGKLSELNEQHARAAKALGQKVDWDKPTRHMVDCDGCSERIPAGTLKHAVPYCGAVQGVKRDEQGHVTNVGMWPKVIQQGMVKKADIPEEIADLL
jgi:hypothetical protein